MDPVEELVYRPLFLRMAKLGGRPFSGRASFLSSRPGALRSLAALDFFLTGMNASPRRLAEGGLSSASASAGLELALGPARSPDAPAWEGHGVFRSGDSLFRFECGAADRLVREAADGARSRVFLPEGGAERYASLDAEECAAQGRESRILGLGERRLASTFPEGGDA